MNALPDFLTPLGAGVYLIDTGFQRPRFDAAYLLVHDGRAAFLDTGTQLALPRHLAAVQALGLPPEAVEWIIPTHVHLDHAGAVGGLAQAFPQARVLVHPRGARHLVDPRALWAGATAVYGEAEMLRSYGQVLPVPAERIVQSHDEMLVHLGSRPLRLIDTPGHARHHHCIWDAATRGWFTGDTFGLSYREFDEAGPEGQEGRAWVLPSVTPVQFEPEALFATLQRLLAAEPDCVYLTHFGRVREIARLADIFRRQLQQMVELGQRCKAQPKALRHEQLKQGLLQIHLGSLAEQGKQMAPERVQALLDLDLELNAQGMACWLDRPAS